MERIRGQAYEGTHRMNVTNPRNGKKCSIPFVVFEGNCLSYQTSLQMKLATVENGHFDVEVSVATES